MIDRSAIDYYDLDDKARNTGLDLAMIIAGWYVCIPVWRS